MTREECASILPESKALSLSWTGGKRMPARFVEPLRDTVDTSVMGYNRMSIRELADRTLALLP